MEVEISNLPPKTKMTLQPKVLSKLSNKNNERKKR